MKDLQFLKNESKGKYQKTLNDDFLAVLVVLANDGVLDVKYRDHDLTGDWRLDNVS